MLLHEYELFGSEDPIIRRKEHFERLDDAASKLISVFESEATSKKNALEEDDRTLDLIDTSIDVSIGVTQAIVQRRVWLAIGNLYEKLHDKFFVEGEYMMSKRQWDNLLQTSDVPLMIRRMFRKFDQGAQKLLDQHPFLSKIPAESPVLAPAFQHELISPASPWHHQTPLHNY